MHHTRLLALAVVAGLAGVARADGESDIVPFRRWSFGADIIGHATHLDGSTAGGFGPSVELAHGRGRVQYFLEGALLFAFDGSMDIGGGSATKSLGGYELRGGAGVRWLARSFVLDRKGSIDMHLEVLGGVERFRWDHGGALTRPDFGVGWAWSVRYHPRHISFHETVRVVFSPHDRVDALAPVSCRGCAMSSSVPDAALMALFGVTL